MRLRSVAADRGNQSHAVPPSKPMKPILVLGATGYTGRLVVRALDRLDRPYIVAGRSLEKLDALAKGSHPPVDVRVFDVTLPDTLDGLFEGVGAVVNTVGPFSRHGSAVVERAVASGVHYVDTTGEQGFQKAVYERFHRAAITAGITVITGQAFEYTFSYCGAALLHERCGPIRAVNSYHQVTDMEVSAGTAKSAAAMLGQEFLGYERGHLVSQRAPMAPRKITFPGEAEPLYAVPFPGGDVVMLPLDIPELQTVTCNVLLPPGQAWAAALLGRVRGLVRPLFGDGLVSIVERGIDRWYSDPAEENRSRVRWTVFVDALSASGAHLCRMTGPDIYAISGETAALGAVWLAEGRARCSGVMTTGRAFDATEFLDALAPCGVSWELR